MNNLTLSPAELNAEMALAEQLSKSSLVPKEFQGAAGAANILMVSLSGKQLGMDTVTSLQSVTVIQNKVSLSAATIAGLIRKAGHSLVITVDDEKAVATGVRTNGDTGSFSFSIDDAKKANLNTGPWRTYPRSMCTARAVSGLARQLFQDVFLGTGGAYTAEELGSDDGTGEEAISLADTVSDSEMVAISEIKKEGLQRFVDAGFSVDDAKPLLVNAWSELNLPSSSSAAFLTGPQAESFRAAVEADVEAGPPAPVEADVEVEVDVEADMEVEAS